MPEPTVTLEQYNQLSPEQSQKIIRGLFENESKFDPFQQEIIRGDSDRKSLHLLIEMLGFNIKRMNGEVQEVDYVLGKDAQKKIETKMFEIIERL